MEDKNKNFGYYGRSEEWVSKTPEGVAYRLELALQNEPQQKSKWPLINGEDPTRNRQGYENINDYSKRMHDKYQADLKDSLEDQQESKAKSVKRTEAELTTMGLDPYDYQPLPRLLRELIQREESE